MTNILSLSLGLLSTTFGPRLIAAVLGQLDTGPLIVQTEDVPWPNVLCSVTPVVMIDKDLAVESFRSEDPLTSAMAAGGAAWNEGYMTLSAFTPDSTPVYVRDFKVIVYRHRDDASPKWVRTMDPGGCGGPIERHFMADIDAPRRSANEVSVVDRGVEGDDPESAAEMKVKRTPLGPGFTTSIADPAKFRLDVTTCTGYTEFGLRIYYNHGGTDFVKEVGSPEEPFRIFGRTDPVPTYTSSLGAPEVPHREKFDVSCTPRFRTDPSAPPPEPGGKCTNTQLMADAGSNFFGGQVDALTCRGRYALQHVEGSRVSFSEYHVYYEKAGRWNEVSNVGIGSNGLEIEKLTSEGVDVTEFASLYRDCVALELKGELIMKRCAQR